MTLAKAFACICLTTLFVTAVGPGHEIYAQQPTASPTVEQEFFDAIKKGNSAKVSELLKQQPSLIKATYKNGITMVMLAVYAHHPEIVESFITTGVEPNNFEAASTARVDSCAEYSKQTPEW